MRKLCADKYLKSCYDINIHISTVEKEYKTHTHDFIEMIFVLDGKGQHIIEDKVYSIEKGDIFILRQNVSHSFVAMPKQPIKVYNCIFQQPFIEEMFLGQDDFSDVAYRYLFHSFSKETDTLPQNYIKVIGANTQEIKIILDEISNEYKKREKGYLQIMRAELMKILILIFRLYYQDKEKERSRNIFHHILVEQTVEYMKKYYAENLSCDYLAKRAYLSSNYFSKIFHECTGYSIIQMLQKIRVEKAMELLQTTLLTVDQVAERVGYSDTKHFYYIFKKVVNCTPGQCRKIAHTRRF